MPRTRGEISWLVHDKCGRCRYYEQSPLSITEGSRHTSFILSVRICFVPMKSAFRLPTETHMKQADITKVFKQGVKNLDISPDQK